MAERHQPRSSSSKLREDKRLPSSESAAKNGLSSRTSRGTTVPTTSDPAQRPGQDQGSSSRRIRTSEHPPSVDTSRRGEEPRVGERHTSANIEVIPDSQPLLVSPIHGTASEKPKPPPPPSSSSSSSSAATSSGDGEDRRTAKSKVNITLTTSSTHSSGRGAMRSLSRPGEKSEVQTSSPPESPDETKVKRKPLAPSFDILPNQTNPPGAAGTAVTKGLMTGGVAGVTGLNQSQSPHLRVTRSPSPSSVSKGGQVPPSPPYNSGSLSSGDLLSAGDGLDARYSQCNTGSFSSGIHMVASQSTAGPRSFNKGVAQISPSKPTYRQVADDEQCRSMTPPPQCCESDTGRSRLLIGDKSLDPDGDNRHGLLNEWESENRKLRSENERLRGLLSTQAPPESLERDRLNIPGGGATPGGVQKQGEEPRYDQQRYLESEVSRLSQCEKEAHRLRKKMKQVEEEKEEAKHTEKQLSSILSDKEAEITELKKNTSGSDTVLREQLRKKDLEISRLKACLSKKEKLLAGGAGGSSDGDLHEATAMGVGVARPSRGGVVSERHYRSGDTENVQELQREIRKKDMELKKANERLQSLDQTASNLVKLQHQSREQSEVIAQLKKEREVTGSEQGKEERHELEKLRAKVNEADTTMRKLMIQNSVLQKEKSKLSTESHLYQTEETERERELLKQLEDQRQAAFDLNGKVMQLSQQNSTLEEQIKSLIRVKDENAHLHQKCVSQMATLQNMEQELHRTKERAGELSSTLEQQKIEAHQLQRQKQVLVGDVEAHKMAAEVYREDFETERKDREAAHAQHVEKEERKKAEIADLKQQLQRVSADNGRRIQQMERDKASLQQQLTEKDEHIQGLKGDKHTLQGELQSKTQQVKQYKKQVDQFRGDMEAFKQQAEHHKQQIEIVVHQREQTDQAAKSYQEEIERLQKENNTLRAREHLQRHASGLPEAHHGGQMGSSINSEEFMKQRRKLQDLERLTREQKQKIEDITLEKVMLVSEIENLQKCLSSMPSSSSRSPPPVTTAAGGGRQQAYPSHRMQGGSPLPNQMRPVVAQPHSNQQPRLNQQMKSSSVDSADMLSSRGHVDPPHKPIPAISVSDSNSPLALPYGNQHGQQPANYQGQQGRRSHTSSHASTNASRGGYPYSSNHGGGIVTNADVNAGVGRNYPQGSPPTNAKVSHHSSSSTATVSGAKQPPPPHPQASTGNVHSHTSAPSNYVSTASTVAAQHTPHPHHHHNQPQQQFGGQQYASGGRSQAGVTNSNAALASSTTGRSTAAGGGSGQGMTSHGRGLSPVHIGPAHSTAATDAHNQPIHIYQNLPFEHQMQHQPSYLAAPALDNTQGSGPSSLPGYGDGGGLRQVPVTGQGYPGHSHGRQQTNYPGVGSSRDDLYLQQQKGVGYGQQRSVEGDGVHHDSYRQAAVDDVEKDSSPPSSLMPPPHGGGGGAPLSLNLESVSQQGLQRRRPISHQMPISPERTKLPSDVRYGGQARGNVVQADSSQPSFDHGVARNNRGGTSNPPPQSSHQLGQGGSVRQQPHQNVMGGAVHPQMLNQRPASSYVKSPVQVSSTSSPNLPPSLMAKQAATMYMPHQEQYKGLSHVAEPDSEAGSNVSTESGVSSQPGGSQPNLNENTLEKGIDGDIRRAARHVKKQLAGRESPAGAKGSVVAPFDPNLVCPSCGLRFRIGEIQKFKRHAGTCTGR